MCRYHLVITLVIFDTINEMKNKVTFRIFSGDATASLWEPYQEVQARDDLMDGYEDQLAQDQQKNSPVW